MSTYSNPGKRSASKTSRQTIFRTTNFRNGRANFCAELSEIMRSKVFSCMASMCPNELHWIEFRCTDRKRINIQTRFSFDEVLNQASLMNGMIVPDQNNGTSNAPQELFEEHDHMLTTQIHSKGFSRQLHFSSPRTDQESTEQVQSLMVIQTGVRPRRLSTGCPTTSKRRNQ